MSNSHFDQLQAALEKGGAEAALQQTANLLRERKKYHELFEVLKMQLRLKLGLQLLGTEPTEKLTEKQRAELEEGLVAACREVGSALLRDGQIREGWMYLRPVGEKAEMAELLRDVETTEENYEELIEICLHEGVDIGRGYGLVLERFGTCNAITQFDSAVVRRPRAEQAPAATL